MSVQEPTNFSAVTIDGGSPQVFSALSTTAAPVNGDPIHAQRIYSLQVTAVASQSFPVALPYGARINNVSFTPTVAPTGTTVTLQIGSTAGGSDIVAATSIKSSTQVFPVLALAASLPLTVANFASITASPSGGSTISLTVVQTGPTAVGAGTVNIDYVMA